MWPLGSCYSWSVHRKFRTHRTLFTGACLWLALQGRSGAAHETQQLQNQPAPSHEMPARQLQYATRIPPSQWELQGVVEARDMERLLLRRTVPGETREPLKPVLIGGSVDYTTEDFQNLAASDLIKMEVAGSSVPSTRDSPALPTGRTTLPITPRPAKPVPRRGPSPMCTRPLARPSKEWALPGLENFPVDLALGQVDALDVVSNTSEIFAAELWYRVLNTGLRCALSAGSDSFTNIMMHWVPGGGRVYVKVPGDFSYQAWIDNYRKGRSFITNGPYLTLSVNGQEPGQELQLSDGSSFPIRVTVEAEVASIVPVDRLEIIVNGLLVKSKPIQGGGRQARITEELVLEKSSWIAARALGPGHRLIMNDPKALRTPVRFSAI